MLEARRLDGFGAQPELLVDLEEGPSDLGSPQHQQVAEYHALGVGLAVGDMETRNSDEDEPLVDDGEAQRQGGCGRSRDALLQVDVGAELSDPTQTAGVVVGTDQDHTAHLDAAVQQRCVEGQQLADRGVVVEVHQQETLARCAERVDVAAAANASVRHERQLARTAGGLGEQGCEVAEDQEQDAASGDGFTAGAGVIGERRSEGTDPEDESKLGRSEGEQTGVCGLTW